MTAATTDQPTAQQRDTLAAAALRTRNDELSLAVGTASVQVRDAADRLVGTTSFRDGLVQLLHDEVMPHLAATDTTLHAAAAQVDRLAPVVQVLRAELARLDTVVEALAGTRTAAGGVAAAAAARVLVDSLLTAQDDVLVPGLLAAQVDVAALVEAVPGVDDATAGSGGGCGCGGCGCGSGGGDAADTLSAQDVQPGDMDVRPLPPAVRHEQIFATVARLLPGEAFVLANDHDPAPLRYQLDAEQPGQIGWEYLAEGPQVWRVLISRTGCC
ncbi:DUF2249 domain-containing protein [Actinotalea sp. K2]|uniref:DUF2249 domain-containing protein n=1 Tax=Actinotalea sp. K2 TaxID=2939438 RepID=UPI002017A59A|nr:DUF2249 domain-containing protein [Actinotalea sp. K2]MCL3862779.1 DUF2249 domain-containing protein [Actinotalea sp. K2]